MKGYDAFVAREHSRAFNAGPICRHCHKTEETHAEVEYCDGYHLECDCDCGECTGFEARDSKEDEQDDPGYYEE